MVAERIWSVFLLFVFILSTPSASSSSLRDGLFQCLSSNPQNSIPSVLYTPKNSSYSSILTSSAQNLRALSSSVKRPLAIITPLNEAEVRAAVLCSRKYGVELRVRSGGHDYEGLSYASESSFIILDLRNLRSIRVDAENKTAWVQAGSILGELYYKIAEANRNLGFPAGTCPTVGVGGHISGGGYSMISRKYGLAADHVLDARLVNVHGQVLDRESMGEDLFWAIRGGGGASFGVILEWKVGLVDVPPTVTVFNVTRTSEENITQLVHRWQYVTDKIDESLLIRLFISSQNSGGDAKRTIQVSFTSMFLGTAETLVKVMQQSFPELGLVREDCTEMSWIQSILYFANIQWDRPLNVLLNRTATRAAYFKGKSDYVREPISEKGLQGLWERLHQVGNSAQLQFTAYGGRMSEIPETETPFPHRSGVVYMVHYIVFWRETDTDTEAPRRLLGWIRMLYQYMAPYVSKDPREAYLNYRDLDLGSNSIGTASYVKARVWGAKYFKVNFERLAGVKKAVDPTNFFKNEQSIPPLPW